MAASPTRHQLRASRLFRWARKRSSGETLKPSSVVTADFNAGGERPALDTHGDDIGRLIGVEGELRSPEQAGSSIFAPQALAGVRALWTGEANDYKVTAYGASRPSHTFIGHLSPANALRFTRLSKASSMVVQDELIVQPHPSSEEVLYIKAYSSPLTRLYGVSFAGTSMGTFAESL